jgi:hypothetical protein
MTKSSRVSGAKICVWFQAGALAAAGLAVVASGAVGARAQTTAPATDTFANNSSPAAVYQDEYSSSCDEKNGASLAMDSPDPARCFDLPAATNGKCTSIGGEGSTLAGQTGNICHYCQGTGPLPGNEIVVPNESGGAATAAYQQGYVCSANPGDSCYLTCYGTKKFTPPTGTTLKAGTPGEGGPPPIKNANARSPLVGHLIFDVPDACHPAGVEQYNVCDYPNLPRPPGCTCSSAAQPAKPAAQPTKPQAAPPLQAASDFSDKLAADAETVLQNAGRISKAMTDAMDVTKHNNVGINVMWMSSLGALGKTMSLVAQQYKALAAASNAVAAAEQTPILEIAGEAAAESGTLASEAEQAAAQAAKAGSASTGTAVGAPAGTPMGTLGGGMVGLLPYQEGMTYLGKSFIQTVGDLPYCGVLSCARLGQLLQANAPLAKAFEAVQVGAEGSTPAQMAAGLEKMGIDAQIATGTTAAATMAKLLGQGKPLIAGVEIFGPGGTPAVGTSGLHAVVIEGAETIGNVPGFKIYDPAGWYYWQPVTTFFKYFSGVIVHTQ